MKSKKKTSNDFGGIMYSTDPEFTYEPEITGTEQSVANKQQDLRVMLDKKNRGGKAVTLVTGFRGNTSDLEKLAKILKTRCGVGGAVKEGEILLQGDFRDKVLEYLLKEDYKAKKSGG